MKIIIIKIYNDYIYISRYKYGTCIYKEDMQAT